MDYTIYKAHLPPKRFSFTVDDLQREKNIYICKNLRLAYLDSQQHAEQKNIFFFHLYLTKE